MPTCIMMLIAFQFPQKKYVKVSHFIVPVDIHMGTMILMRMRIRFMINLNFRQTNFYLFIIIILPLRPFISKSGCLY